jgi:ABC-type multidrug transport system fused ATPase/permease subunit
LLIVLTCVAEFFLLKFLNSREKQTRDETSKLVTKFDYFYNLSKNFEASKDIKIYGFGDYFIIAIAKIIAGIENVIAKYTKRSASVNGVRALLNTVRQFIAWVYLIYLVSNNRLSVSDFVFYFGIITGFSDWVIRLVLGYSWIERCCNDCNAFRKFVESDEQGINKPDVNFDNVETLEFKNVSFSYQGSDNMTIKNMSFKINNGENLAVVGRNGSGKTTFIKLLCRLYDVTDGEILINGINIKEYTKNSLLKLYSVVFQDFKIFSTTIAQNISASEKYDSNKLYDALDKANIRDRVMAMENKERTYLYKNIDKSGVEISGGEAQKLALARALYKNAPVVILDEPTAALDPIAENEIYSRFNSFVKGKTAIYISHRLSSCAFCDNIAVFDNAQLVEFGTHNDLLNANGKYSQLWTAQAKYYV